VVGVDLEAALAALSTATVSAMRMEMLTSASGATIVNDAYNANPTSMIAALDALAAMDADRRIAVLGRMAEIDDAEAAHRRVATHALDRDLEFVAVGTADYGVEPFDDPIAAIGELGPRDVVLVKASRSAGLERLVARLAAR